MKEYAILSQRQEYATEEREVSVDEILFAKFLLYQKCVNEINNKPEHIAIKTQLNGEKDIDKKGSIIYSFIMSNYLRQLINIDNYRNARDILYFNSVSDYLNQFNI